RRGLVPRVPGRIPGRESAGSSRLFVPAVWDAGRLRRDSMLVRRLVRRVTRTQVSGLRTVGEIPYHSTSSFLCRRTCLRRKELQPVLKPKRPRIPYRKTYYLVLWWMSQTPYAAIFENQVAAEAAANVRNALLVTISGRDAKVDQILDWYRRDESGRPMPAEWRDLGGQIGGPGPANITETDRSSLPDGPGEPKTGFREKFLFYTGIFLILLGGPGIALGSWLHDVMQISVGEFRAFDVFGPWNRLVTAIGLIVLIVGIVFLILSLRFSRPSDVEKDLDALRES